MRKGQKHTKESIEKNRLAHLGLKHGSQSEERKELTRQAHTGKRHSDERRRVNSEAQKRYWASRSLEERQSAFDAANAAHQFENTRIEQIVRGVLAMIKIDFVEQYRVGPYRCDFFVPSKLLVTECDGDYWHASEESKVYDRRRDIYMTNLGLTVKRLRECDIYSDALSLVQKAVN